MVDMNEKYYECTDLGNVESLLTNIKRASKLPAANQPG